MVSPQLKRIMNDQQCFKRRQVAVSVMNLDSKVHRHIRQTLWILNVTSSNMCSITSVKGGKYGTDI